jgi:hypothetical protein
MRLFEILRYEDQQILNEVSVNSSWIEDIDIEQDGNDVIMTLLSGRMYRLFDVPNDMFEMWTEASSPGKFWHDFIAGRYNTTRIA